MAAQFGETTVSAGELTADGGALLFSLVFSPDGRYWISIVCVPDDRRRGVLLCCGEEHLAALEQLVHDLRRLIDEKREAGLLGDRAGGV